MIQNLITQFNHKNDDRERIAEVFKKLFDYTYIPNMEWSPAKKRFTKSTLYADINTYRDLIESVLDVMGFELRHEYSTKVFYLYSREKINTITPEPSTLRIMFTINQIYLEKASGDVDKTITTKAEIREKGAIVGTLDSKLPEQHWKDTLSFMKRHNLIVFEGNVSDITDDTPIYIYPIISIYINSELMARMEEEYLLPDSDDNSPDNEVYEEEENYEDD